MSFFPQFAGRGHRSDQVNKKNATTVTHDDNGDVTVRRCLWKSVVFGVLNTIFAMLLHHMCDINDTSPSVHLPPFLLPPFSHWQW